MARFLGLTELFLFSQATCTPAGGTGSLRNLLRRDVSVVYGSRNGPYLPRYFVQAKRSFVNVRQLGILLYLFFCGILLLERMYRRGMSIFKNSYIFTVLPKRRQFKCRDVGGSQFNMKQLSCVHIITIHLSVKINNNEIKIITIRRVLCWCSPPP
jgi:hypothetical protein